MQTEGCVIETNPASPNHHNTMKRCSILFKKSVFVSILLCTFLCYFSFAYSGGKTSVDDPVGDMFSFEVSERSAACGDIKSVSFEWQTALLLISTAFVNPPFSAAAEELLLDLELTCFAFGAPVQSKVNFKVNRTGKVGFDAPPSAALIGAELVGSDFVMRFRIPNSARRIGVSIKTRLIWQKGWVTDEVEYFSFKLEDMESSDPATSQSLPPTQPDDKRVLSRDNYIPPVGGYLWKDDPEKALALFEEAKQFINDDPRKARKIAEEAYCLTPDYILKEQIVAFLMRIPMKGYEQVTPTENNRTKTLLLYEHLRVLYGYFPLSWPAKILQATYASDIRERYGLQREDDKVKAFKEDYLSELRLTKIPEVERARITNGEKDFLRLGAEAYKKKEYEAAFAFYSAYLLYLTTGMAEGDRKAAEEGLLLAGEAACNKVDKDEKKILDDILNHKAFKDITTRASDHFIILGPSDAVTRIPDSSLRNFDIGFTVQADFFDTSPSKREKRITVFLRELYGHAAGHAGGDMIFISFKFSKRQSSAMQIDNQLYMHELVHCMCEYEFPVAGLNEGIADLGASLSLLMLNRDESESRTFASKSFEDYFVKRKMPFNLIQQYAPADGFLFLPLAKSPMQNGKYEWSKLRAVMRDLKSYPLKPVNTEQWLKHYMKILEPYFGDKAYEWYRDCGLDIPLGLKYLLSDELNYYNADLKYAKHRGHNALFSLANRIASENPTSYFRQMALLEAVKSAAKLGDDNALTRFHKASGTMRSMIISTPIPCSAKEQEQDLMLSIFEVWPSEGIPADLTNIEYTKVQNCEADGFFEMEEPDNNSFHLISFFNKLIAPWEGYLYLTTPSPYVVWIDDMIVCRGDSAYDGDYDGVKVPLSLSAGTHRLLIKVNGRSKLRARVRILNLDCSPPDNIVISNAPPPEFRIRVPVTSLKLGETIIEDSFSSTRTILNWMVRHMTFNFRNEVFNPVQAVCMWSRFYPPYAEDPTSNVGLLLCRKSRMPDMIAFSATFMRREGTDIRGAMILDSDQGDEVFSGLSLYFERMGDTVVLDVKRYSTTLFRTKKTCRVKPMKFTVYRYQSWVWVELNDISVLPFFRVEPMPTGVLGIALTNSMSLSDVNVKRIQQK